MDCHAGRVGDVTVCAGDRRIADGDREIALSADQGHCFEAMQQTLGKAPDEIVIEGLGTHVDEGIGDAGCWSMIFT